MAIAGGLLAALAVLAVGYFFLRKKVQSERLGIRTEADRVLAEANRTAESKLREATIEAKEKVLA
ncbi:MAG TPA: Rnase Y domain-containing protein, partial [Thermoanaerobaculia bacterium]|nr:Rnase Y domain-containing protein [Thermoanaerobaculia bacterium]